ncbi:MAG: SOS response-associated peptidase [bacterium]|jgi:putative SOS response-associated peptidase YedK
MCGRFALSSVADLKARFNIDPGDDIKPRYNIAPSQQILAIVNQGGYKLVELKWGLVPFWTKDKAKAKGIINARAETLDTKPSFKHCLQRQRCLIPADGFYEWKKEGNRKRPYRIIINGGELFVFAGLWDRWRSPAGEVINTCAIITTTANKFMAPIHNRMPVILPKEREKIWLASNTDVGTLKSLLQPYPAQLLDSYEISTLINSPHNDIPQVLEPVN